MKFKKKPVVIDAVQWQGTEESFHACCGKFGLKKDAANAYETPDGLDLFLAPGDQFIIETLEGRMLVNPGDWVIRGVKGEFYPCKPDIFERTYDPVGAATAAVDNGDPAVV